MFSLEESTFLEEAELLGGLGLLGGTEVFFFAAVSARIPVSSGLNMLMASIFRAHTPLMKAFFIFSSC